jgi:hypothetical protein
MNFKQIKTAVQRQFNHLKGEPLFRIDLDKDKLWETYLKSFPEGTNPIFRERTEHDCSCCRSFIKNVGDLVAIKDGELVSIWDCKTGDPSYQTVVDALSEFVKSHSIGNIFLHPFLSAGEDKSYEQDKKDSTKVITWEHFHIQLPREIVPSGADIGPRLSDSRASHDVLLRSLKEISSDSIETVQDLIAQNSLYRGAEKKALLDTFAKMKKEFSKLKNEQQRDLFVWSRIRGQTAFASRMRNDVIGTLLVDLTEGKELDAAVKSFEDKVSGTNYKRPTALITPKMRDAAKAKLVELGLMPALERRFAVLEDIKINNVLFANRSAKKRMNADVFDELPTKGQSEKSMGKVEEISIADFIAKVLPTAKSLEVMVENRHSSNLVSLTAPCDLTAPSLFKWPNPFAWSYNGDVTDSIKERVKLAGGTVEGDVCCRLAWSNEDDLDFHMSEPDGGEINFRNRRSANGGVLDVDANGMDGVRKDPCENIVYRNLSTMRKGTYKLWVHQYHVRSTADVGFDVDIDIGGEVHHFSYPKAVQRGDVVQIAEIQLTPAELKVLPKLEASTSVKEVWGIKTQTFHPVQALMLSPNFWDEKEMGNKHFFFMLEGCKNDGQARGFYNEFLKSELESHRKTMEIVGSKMKVEKDDKQLSGIGFSSTQRNSVLCKVEGAFTRILKVTF